jgi:hypothetical protein
MKRKEDKKHCVYKFIGFDDTVLYVGKTSNFKTRMKMHNNLPKECYKEINKVEVLSFNNIDDMSQAEGYFINLYNPIYNVKSEMFNKVYDTTIWENCIFDFLISSKDIKDHKPVTVDILFFDNVPQNIKNKFLEIKNNITCNNLQKLIDFLNNNYVFDKSTETSATYVTFSHGNNEFNSNPQIGFKNNKIKFSCAFDNYVPESIENFYYIDLKMVYDMLIILCNYHFNNNIFNNVKGRLHEVIFIPIIRKGILINSREQLHEIINIEVRDRLSYVENIKSRNPVYYKQN